MSGKDLMGWFSGACLLMRILDFALSEIYLRALVMVGGGCFATISTWGFVRVLIGNFIDTGVWGFSFCGRGDLVVLGYESVAV